MTNWSKQKSIFHGEFNQRTNVVVVNDIMDFDKIRTHTYSIYIAYLYTSQIADYLITGIHR